MKYMTAKKYPIQNKFGIILQLEMTLASVNFWSVRHKVPSIFQSTMNELKGQKDKMCHWATSNKNSSNNPLDIQNGLNKNQGAL